MTVKKFENWAVFYEVIRRTKMCHYSGHPVFAIVPAWRIIMAGNIEWAGCRAASTGCHW